MTALFLSPHPDDVELFCGGIVARLAATTAVHLADLTRGEMSSNGTAEGRAAEAEAAARALGVRAPREQLGLPDAGLDARDPEQAGALVGLLRRLRPEIVFAPWPEDRHPDHVAAGRLARRAVGRAASTGDPDRGEPHSVGRLFFYPCHHAVEPSLLVDVSGVIDRWDDAVRCYASQFLDADAAGRVATPINRPDFLEQHRRRRALWGARAGTDYAEALVLDGPWTLDARDLLAGRKD